ncbi:M48 family metallopeptidase [Histidinibacterium lentulum]|uniref:M48 family peptidase n=1 Tax=Histidinibacterium lentulum TaxID=2480588 RepID=A0A3N2R8C5_9RHOB|nr:SprT family zinc-dependent metalloprotease [Histidinibacterium lentulum]ROU03677.1 M48 family peptidase [Histidinibacterium lentulum]
MGDTLRLGNPPIDILLRRSARARRLTLRVSRIDGRVTLTLPPKVAEREALRFAREREAWLRSHIDGRSPPAPLAPGATVPFEGRPLPLVAARVRGPRLEEGVLKLPDDGAPCGPRVAAFLRTAARDRLARASDNHAAALGRSYGRITLRDTRSRWGSCTSEGNLMYSWRLVMAPPEVLDYVAAHEVAHLQEMNHSRAFWAVVARLVPGYDAHRLWLRSHGAELHAVRFDGA